jgi:hypothetical protein
MSRSHARALCELGRDGILDDGIALFILDSMRDGQPIFVPSPMIKSHSSRSRISRPGQFLGNTLRLPVFSALVDGDVGHLPEVSVFSHKTQLVYSDYERENA